MERGRHIQLEETKQHGSFLFPFNIYPCTIPGDFPSVALHWHKSMEIIFVKKGCMQVQLDRMLRFVSSSDICIVPPGTLHSMRGLEGCQVEYENLICEPEFLGSGAADLCAKQYLVPLAAGTLLRPMHLCPGDAGYDLCADCLKTAETLCEEKTIGYELGIKAAMLQLVRHLLQLQPELPVMEPPGMARLKLALQRIHRDYGQALSVEEMADTCGCSSSHFMRWFRQMTGSSFVTYLNEYRLTAAAERLRSTEEKVLSIAQEVGFESLSNFNHQFKQRYGMTPRQYRTSK